MARRMVSPTFVGRRAELDRLGEAVDLATAGEGSLVLVAGDAGVGKSRLVDEFALRARAAGAVVAIGGCVDLGDAGVPYAPLVEVLRDLVGQFGARWADIGGEMPDELTPFLIGLSAPPGPPPGGQSESAQGRLFELVLSLLRRVGDVAPLCAVFEDLQWADASTRDLVMFLARNLRRGRAVVVGTYRLDDLHRRHPLRPLLAELLRAGVWQLQLAGFDRVELAAQLTGIAGCCPPSGTVDELLARSEGNAFYAEELFAALRAGQQGLPETLRDVVLSRIEQLPEVSQEVLQVLGVVGRQGSHALLARVAALSDDDLDDALAAALAAQVLVGVRPDGYAFRHALVQEAVVEDILPGRRRRLHREIAEILAECPALANSDPSTVAAMLAHHWQQAGEAARSLHASMIAGRAADAMAAPAEAKAHYERALSLWEQVADPAALAGADRVDVTMAAANAAYRLGDVKQAISLARGAVDVVDDGHDTVRAALIRERLARFSWLAGDSRTAFVRYSEAVTLLADEDPPSAARARVLAAYGQALMMMGRRGEAADQCREAIVTARAAGDRGVEGHASNTLGVVLQSVDWQEGLRCLRAALGIAQELGVADDLLRAHNNLADALGYSGGRLAEAAELARAGIDIARRTGCMTGMGSLLESLAAQLLVRLGRLSEAEALLDDMELPRYQGIVRIEALLARAELAQAKGDLSSAETMVAAAIADLPPHLHVQQRWLVIERAASVATAAGRYDDARVFVDQARALGGGADGDVFAIGAATLGVRVEAEAVASGEQGAGSQRAAVLLAEAGERAERVAANGTGLNPMLDARLSVAGADADDAARRATPTVWAEAVSKLDQVGLTLEAVRARLRQAEATLNGHGPRDVAAELVDQARRVAERAGATPLVAECDRLILRARLEPVTDSTPMERVGQISLCLTARELEVLGYLAAGRTNRQIATALFISEKTASVHVSNLVRKLGVINRIEAGAIGQRHGVAMPTTRP